MPIDLDTEEFIPLKEASQHIPGRPHLATVYRWVNRRKSPLETFKVGGRVFTTKEAIHRFIQNCSDPTTQPVTTREQKRRLREAERELIEAGVMEKYSEGPIHTSRVERRFGRKRRQ